ncbi:MAG: hypothetical protein ACI86C_001910, partial [Candidatus Latescibacterota bacterium]
CQYAPEYPKNDQANCNVERLCNLISIQETDSHVAEIDNKRIKHARNHQHPNILAVKSDCQEIHQAYLDQAAINDYRPSSEFIHKQEN